MIVAVDPHAIIGELIGRVTRLARITSGSHPLCVDGVFVGPEGHSEYELGVNGFAGNLFADELASDVALDAAHTRVG